jgi:mono/diheme cytochrome c family protein
MRRFTVSPSFKRPSSLWILCLTAIAPLAAAAFPNKPAQGKAAPPETNSKPISFARDIRPILSDKCFKCHGPDSIARMANLRLDTEKGAFADLNGAHPFVPGDPAKSLAYERMTSKDPAKRMPPPNSNRTLTQAQIELIRRWIQQGAQWQKHWSFIPPVRPGLPEVKNKAWAKNAIDRFILARLQREGIKPSAAAPKEKLIRRVTLDLTGLPPTREELDAFLSDASPTAYETVVDRLLRSPRFGERWVWEWLDAARYSDTNGYQEDRARPMWPWRDWAINALNSNMPFDQFTVEQIAGDMLPNATVSQKIATGFNRNHMLNGEGGRIPEESRVEYVMDRVDTTSTVWLGVTMGCARCHDHKYDPFTQKEYYQFYAYFNNIPESGGVDRNGSANPVISLPTPEQTARIAELQKSIGELNQKLSDTDKKLREEQPEWERKSSNPASKVPANIAALLKVASKDRTAAQSKELTTYYLSQSPARVELQKQVDAARKSVDETNNAVILAMVMEEMPKPRDTHILIRGAYDKPGDPVSCGLPAVLPPLPTDTSNSRLGLAKWLVDPSNPLTARVAVNRFWQTLFGTGLVKTAEDFGVQGEAASHPELLDWLATEFMRTKWDVKGILKQIVMSATYRQTSDVTPALLEKDPENRLLARGPRFRLPSFVLRDQALALSGLLVEKVGGPPVKPYQPEGVWEDFSYGKITYTQDHGESLYRRSLYTFWRRSVAPTDLFDTGARRGCTVRMTRTNTPLQALTTLNDTTFVEASRVFAERVMKSGKTPEERISAAFRMATARRPTPAELAVLTRGYQRYLNQYKADPEAAKKLITVGESKPDAKLDSAELAATTNVMSLILNLDEVMSKE